jgi:hypothetical protein
MLQFPTAPTKRPSAFPTTAFTQPTTRSRFFKSHSSTKHTLSTGVYHWFIDNYRGAATSFFLFRGRNWLWIREVCTVSCRVPPRNNLPLIFFFCENLPLITCRGHHDHACKVVIKSCKFIVHTRTAHGNDKTTKCWNFKLGMTYLN